MKYVRVNIECILEVPDGAEVSTHPEDEVPCLRMNGLWFAPAFEWARRDPDGEWTVAGEEFEQLAEPRTENTTLQALSEEEFQARYSSNGSGEL